VAERRVAIGLLAAFVDMVVRDNPTALATVLTPP
jgi:hypothetical protein